MEEVKKIIYNKIKGNGVEIMKCPVCENETDGKICVVCGYSLENDVRIQKLLHQLSSEEIECYQMQLSIYQENYRVRCELEKTVNALKNEIKKLRNNQYATKRVSTYTASLEDIEYIEDYVRRVKEEESKDVFVLENGPLLNRSDLIDYIKDNLIFCLDLDGQLAGCIQFKYSFWHTKVTIYNFYCDNYELAFEMMSEYESFINHRMEPELIEIQTYCDDQKDVIKKFERLGFKVKRSLTHKGNEVTLEYKV